MSVPPESVVPPPVNEQAPAGDIPAEERTWAMMAHLSALLGGLLTASVGRGWGCFIGPLIIWLVKKDTMPFVNDQAKEALNFNITVALASLVLLVLSIIGIAWLVLTIVAAVKANEGVRYRYPFALRFIK